MAKKKRTGPDPRVLAGPYRTEAEDRGAGMGAMRRMALYDPDGVRMGSGPRITINADCVRLNTAYWRGYEDAKKEATGDL